MLTSNDSLGHLRWVFVVGFCAVLAFVIRTQVVAGTAANTVADRELGQPDFVHNTANTPNGAVLNIPGFIAVDASVTPNRLYMSDSGNNRVLGYHSVAALMSGASADLVIGQPDLYSVGCNNSSAVNVGTVSAATLCNPTGIAVDTAGNVVVADTNNNRVLRYNNPFTTMVNTGMVAGFAANWVMGQVGDFTSDLCNLDGNGPSDETLCRPQGVALDGAGDLYIGDNGNNRILEYNGPLSTATRADRVFGQKGSFFSGAANNGGISANSLSAPAGLAVDKSGHLYAADLNNSRVLIYTDPLGTNGTTANVVFGQGGSLATGGCNLFGLNADSLCGPSDVKIDSSGDVYIADFGNNRILEYRTPVGTNPTASVVFGQAGSVTLQACNMSVSPSKSTLCGPSGLGIDSSGNLYVADQMNNRVLRYMPPFPALPAAQLELGQPNFAHNLSDTVNPAVMNQPAGVAIDESVVPNHLYVADESNNRILGYASVPSFLSGAPANIVIGQSDLYSNSCNQNGPVGPTTLCGPQGISVDSAGNLVVPDTQNNRVLEFTAPFKSTFTADQPADAVFGQGDSFTSNGCNSQDGVSAGSLCNPTGTAIDRQGRLYVADLDNNRILQFVPPFGVKPVAKEVIGQSSFTTNSGGTSESTLNGPL